MIGKDGSIMLLYGPTKYIDNQGLKAMKMKTLMIHNKIMTQMMIKEVIRIMKDKENLVKILHSIVLNLNPKCKR
jgi:hypothetical protein